MNAIGIYYDGKTSKPYNVILSSVRRPAELSIRSRNDNTLFGSWLFSEIEIVKYRKGDILQLGTFQKPMESVRITGSQADEFYSVILEEQTGIEKISQSIFTANPLKLVLASAFLLISVLSLYFFVISPWVAEKAVAIIPKSAEVTMGQAAWNTNSRLFEEDSTKSVLLQEFFDLCGFETGFDVKMHYMDAGMVNAFALPGGNIAIFEGIIDKTECWSELAGIIAHEASHVSERHSMKLLARSVASYLVLSVITGDVAGASGIILENVNQLNQTSNTRAFEKEADIVGLQMLRDNKIDPYGLRDVFSNILGSSEIEAVEGQSRVMEYLSTHPLSSTRVKYIEETIKNDISYNYEYREDERLEEIWSILKKDTDAKNKRVERVLERSEEIIEESQEAENDSL